MRTAGRSLFRVVACLALLLALVAGQLKEAGGSMALVAPEGRVLQLLNLTGMSSILKVHGDVNAAAAAV